MIRDLNKLIRYLAYVLELLVLFMLQETPGLLPSIFGARPVLLFPAVVAIAMLEPEVPALLFGVVGGLFCDFGLSGMLGFHALVLGVLCFFISLVIRAYLQNNMATAILTGVWSIGLVVLSVFLPIFLSGLCPYPPLSAKVCLHPVVPSLALSAQPGPFAGAGRAGEGDPVM